MNKVVLGAGLAMVAIIGGLVSAFWFKEYDFGIGVMNTGFILMVLFLLLQLKDILVLGQLPSQKQPKAKKPIKEDLAMNSPMFVDFPMEDQQPDIVQNTGFKQPPEPTQQQSPNVHTQLAPSETEPERGLDTSFPPPAPVLQDKEDKDEFSDRIDRIEHLLESLAKRETGAGQQRRKKKKKRPPVKDLGLDEEEI